MADWRGVILGGALIIGIVAPQITWLVVPGQPESPITEGFYFVYLGAIILASYLFPSASFLFRGITWAVVHLGVPHRTYMVLVYAATFFLVGAVKILVLYFPGLKGFLESFIPDF